MNRFRKSSNGTNTTTANTTEVGKKAKKTKSAKSAKSAKSKSAKSAKAKKSKKGKKGKSAKLSSQIRQANTIRARQAVEVAAGFGTVVALTAMVVLVGMKPRRRQDANIDAEASSDLAAPGMVQPLLDTYERAERVAPLEGVPLLQQ